VRRRRAAPQASPGLAETYTLPQGRPGRARLRARCAAEPPSRPL